MYKDIQDVQNTKYTNVLGIDFVAFYQTILLYSITNVHTSQPTVDVIVTYLKKYIMRVGFKLSCEGSIRRKKN